MHRTPEADELWHELYMRYTKKIGRKVVDRAEAHMLRLSMLYTLLDGQIGIDTGPLLAAQALWDYSERGALQIFGTEELSANAQKALDYLQSKAHEGASRNEVRLRVFNGHLYGEKLAEVMDELKMAGQAVCGREKIERAWTERWFAVPQAIDPPKSSKKPNRSTGTKR
jgi:hypothetical protein